MRLTALAHEYLSGAIRRGDLVIDATAGNGPDTCFLAQRVGAEGRVFAFDVQRAALHTTSTRLAAKQLTKRVTLVRAGHETLAKHLPAGARGTVAAVTFNLGYLPGSDKRLTTQPATTLKALDQTLSLLRLGGIVTLLVYVGHRDGAAEYRAVSNWLNEHTGGRFALTSHRGAAEHSPVLFVLERRS